MKSRATPLTLGNSYDLHWADYARLGVGAGETFRLLVMPVKKPETQQAVAPTPRRLADPVSPPKGATPRQTRGSGRRSKYAPVVEYLSQVGRDRVELTYEQIEEMIAGPLPPVAYEYRSAWANTKGTTWPLMRLVLAADWKVESVQMGHKVVFGRVAG